MDNFPPDYNHELATNSNSSNDPGMGSDELLLPSSSTHALPSQAEAIQLWPYVPYNGQMMPMHRIPNSLMPCMGTLLPMIPQTVPYFYGWPPVAAAHTEAFFNYLQFWPYGQQPGEASYDPESQTIPNTSEHQQDFAFAQQHNCNAPAEGMAHTQSQTPTMPAFPDFQYYHQNPQASEGEHESQVQVQQNSSKSRTSTSTLSSESGLQLLAELAVTRNLRVEQDEQDVAHSDNTN